MTKYLKTILPSGHTGQSIFLRKKRGFQTSPVWPRLTIFKAFATEISYRGGKNILQYFEKHDILSKTAVQTFWATFGIIGLLFILPSRHTGLRSERNGEAEAETEGDFDSTAAQCGRHQLFTLFLFLYIQ